MSGALLVAVSQRVDVLPERGECRDALDQRLAGFVAAAGGIPVPVPNGLGPGALVRWMEALRPVAILLSGGNDLGQRLERDRTEELLLASAKRSSLPVLGICRGMQMLGVWAGGSLLPVAGHVRTRHRLRTGDASGPWPEEVNSFHNHALAGCPAGFRAAAWAEDGVVEAMVHDELPWEGWMWHPEREPATDRADVIRLERLLARGGRA